MEIEFREEEIKRTVPRELADELQDAPLGDLRGSAASPQAMALVEHLAPQVPPCHPSDRWSQAKEPSAQTCARF